MNTVQLQVLLEIKNDPDLAKRMGSTLLGDFFDKRLVKHSQSGNVILTGRAQAFIKMLTETPLPTESCVDPDSGEIIVPVRVAYVDPRSGVEVQSE